MPFSFYDVYDMVFSFWLGLAIFITAQFFGLGFLIAITLSFVLFVYDLTKLVECVYYILNVTPGSQQLDEFTWLHFVYYPLKRFVINICLYELPITLSATIKAVITVLSTSTALSSIAIRNGWST